jgi:hypothetical protein
VRTHCFISTSRGEKGARWAWHTSDEKGIATKSSGTLFANFNDCVDDARAHGFHHVEVPVLDWSVGVAQAPAKTENVAPDDTGEAPQNND